MQQTRPLPSHPEFSVIDYPGYREYCVENFYVARDGSGRIVRRATGLSWYWAVIPVLLSLAPVLRSRWLASWILITLVLVLRKVTQVAAETVLVIPPHGIQLETHRGFPKWPIFISRRFIPLTTLQDVIINEGLWGWNVRHYLAAVKEHSAAAYSLDVVFGNILPRMPILLEVYHGIHDMLLLDNNNEVNQGESSHRLT